MKTLIPTATASSLRKPALLGEINGCLLSALEYVRPLALDGVHIAPLSIDLVFPRVTTVSSHVHAELQLEFILCGRATISTAESKLAMATGQGVAVMPQTEHGWQIDNKACMLSILLCVSGSEAGNFLTACMNGGKKRIADFGNSQQGIYARQIIELALKPPPYHWRREMMGGLIHQFIAESLHQITDLKPWKRPVEFTKNEPGDRTRALCEEVVRFINQNYSRPLQLLDIANHAGISGRHLNRIFKEHTGETVGEVVRDIRLQKAADMLSSDSSLTVREIAYKNGFASPGHFSRQFLKRFGRLPRNFTPDAIN